MEKLFGNYIKKSFEIKEINKIVHRTKEYFGEFSRYYLYIFYYEFDNAIIRKYGDLFDQFNSIIQQQLDIFFKDIFYISIRVLIVEMNIMKDENKLVGANSQERYLYYSELLTKEEYIDYLISKYPVLNRILLEKCKNQIRLINECLSNYIQDFEPMCETFEISAQSKIKQIIVTSGDSHNGGKKVILLELSENKILYKPHDFSSEKIFNEILESINKEQCIKYKLKTIKNITRDNYAWQDYIKAIGCTKIQEVEEYYYKIGAYLAVLYSLGCEDIHKENIIASGNNPYLIDMETLSNCQAPLINDKATMLEHFFYENSQSVFGTMLLPTNSAVSIFDYDIGGISGDDNIETSKWEAFDIKNQGTDNLQFVKESKFITGGCDNIVKLNGEATRARDYYKNIIEGFSDCYKIFIKTPNKVVDILKESEVIIRQVLRPTAVYSKFLEASTYPTYLTNEESFRGLFAKLDNLEEVKEKKKAQIEIESLYEFDIPYFYSDLNTTNIYSVKGKVDNYISYSVMDAISGKAKKFSEKDLKVQIYYINLALSTQPNTSEMIYKYNLFSKSQSLKNITINHIAKQIGDVIEEKLIWDYRKQSCFFMIDTVVKEKRKYCSMDSSLYGSGGVILYYLSLYKATCDLKYKHIVEGLINGHIGLHSKKSLEEGIGLFSGLTSLAYIYYQCYRVLGKKQYLEDVLEVLKEIEENLHMWDELDLSTGLSGVIIFLSELYKTENNEQYLLIANGLADKLYKLVLKANFNMLTGLAHGYAGVAWALYSIGHIVNNEDYINCAMKCIEEENMYYDSEKNNWKDKRNGSSESFYWCYGAFGIGIARLKMYEIAHNDILLKDIEKCREIYINYNLINSKYNHSLCHGLTGNLSAIKMFSDFYKNDNKLKKKYKEMLDILLNDIVNGKVIWGDKELIEDYSFMIGLSGIGYELLRHEATNSVNILALEV